MNKKIFQGVQKLHKLCSDSEYKGVSLYDSHNSPIPFHRLGPRLSFYVNQINKRSPINFRKILRIKKGINPKGMGLFLYSYLLNDILGNPIEVSNPDEKTKHFFRWLVENSSKDNYSGYCWGYNYPWPKTNGLLIPPYTPSSVVTAFNIRAIFQYFLHSKEKMCIELIKGAEKFILNDIIISETDRGICFSYTPLERDFTLNASLKAAEILAYSDFVMNKSDNQHLIEKAISFVMSYQNENGSWYYAIDPKTGKPDKQIDFHQGYILETLKRITDFSLIDINEFENCITRGLNFYRKKQFSDDGISLWRFPKKWPIDIHNQSQGIITFSMFKDYNQGYLDFAEKIALWTINNMQSKVNGAFYYQKWPLITNKMNYMRWNQGWMFLALNQLLFHSKFQD
tara:strand:- start:9603 stop:10796 length:1194 start_codon:yes stop_codon:yes gene_type:complete